MKRLLFTLCCLASIVAQAQLKTMLKPGRAWQMTHHTLNLFHEEEGTEYHTTKSYMLFVGDTSYVNDDGRTCYEIIYGDERSDIKPYPIACVYEEDGRIYESSDDCAMPPSPRLVLDFTPKAGGRYPYYNGSDSPDEDLFSYRNVNKVDSIMVNGELCKRIHLGGTGYLNEDTYLVEGIGMSNDNLLWFNTYYESASNGIIEWNTLDAVYDGGNCIFRASEFDKPAYNEPAIDVAPDDVASIWNEGSEWQVHYDAPEAEGPVSEVIVRYRLGRAENGLMALEKTESINGVKGTPEIVGYVRNEDNTTIYLRPVQPDGSIGQECLLYDFSTPFEYGNTIRYGVEGGGVETEYIDWQKDSLDYYQLSGGSRLLPVWGGIIYRYGYIGGPLELFQRHCVPGRTKGPRPTNISHVIFTTKGGQKSIHRVASQEDKEVAIPYNTMLTDGTRWDYLTVQKSNPQDMSTSTVEVVGDTIIGSRTCRVVASPDHRINKVVFEEGRKLYLVGDDDSPSVLLDFGLEHGDVLDEVTSVLTGTTENQDYSYRTIIIQTGRECASYFAGDTTPWSYTLIEGIGVSKDEFLPQDCLLRSENTISYLLRCWKNGRLVYRIPLYEAVAGINKMAVETHQLYDLQGRQLRNAPRKGLYINGDKKIIRR